MKYCTKCGAKMNDDALFCPKCGTKVEEVVNEKPSEQPVEEKPVVNNEVPQNNANAKIKGKAIPLYEQKVRDIILLPIVIIVCSIALWIVNAVGHPTGVGKVFPLFIFIGISAFYAVMSMIRAVKTLTRKIYFKSVLSFVFFGLLFVCIIIDIVALAN